MTVTVKDIADWVHGELLGDSTRTIQRARPLTDAIAGDLTFVEDEKYLNAWHASAATAAIVPKSFAVNGKPIIRVDDPLMSFVTIVRKLRGQNVAATSNLIHPTAVIHPTAIVGADSSVGPYAVIGENARIGSRCTLHAGVSIGRHCQLADDVTLHPHVVLYDDCSIGNRVIIHAHAVIGADGFGYRTVAGKHVKVPQLGSVEVGDDVEIGACSTIDRGTFGPTKIGVGTKIDNQVMIGHNCKIGRHNILVSQVGIAGSTTTGDYVVMAGQVGVGDHLTIGDKVMLGAKAGVHQNVPAGSRMLGCPATPDREQMKMMMTMQKLPDMRKDLKRILQKLGLDEAA
ncbi:MAG: UDP-3-O-(3-hydroxymyristoyl)glucosamine N-acyltransferase [Gemmataceae bacterium]